MFFLDFPSGDVAAGDIYRGLPSFGLLPRERVAGIVITPACDLEQSKTPTASYLPIVSIAEFVAMPETRRRLIAGFSDLGKQHQQRDLRGMGAEALTEVVEKAAVAAQGTKRSRLEGLRDYLKATIAGDNNGVVEGFRRAQTPKAFSQEIRALIADKYNDTHYLPAPLSDLPAFEDHSVALLRYPLTIPYPVLELANDPTVTERATEWLAALRDVNVDPGRWAEPPLRCHRLAAPVLADLATRFAALYGRIGSADLSQEAVERVESSVANTISPRGET